MKKYLFFDTETNGLPKDPRASFKIPDAWPRLVSIAWIITDENKNVLDIKKYYFVMDVVILIYIKYLQKIVDNPFDRF